jgi:hypothetical protein
MPISRACSSPSGSTRAAAARACARRCSIAPGRLMRVRPPQALPLPRRQLLAYGAFGLPLAMAALPVYVHVPRLYADAAGMSLSLLGALLLAARLLDAGIDPLARRLERPDGESPAPDRARPALPRAGHAGPAAPAAVRRRCGCSARCWHLLRFLAGQRRLSGLGCGTRPRCRRAHALTASREGFGLLGVVLAAALPGLISSDLARASRAGADFPAAAAAAGGWTLPRHAAGGGAAPAERQGARRPARGARRWSLSAPAGGLRGQRHCRRACRRRWSCSSSPMCCRPKPGAALSWPSTSSAASLSCPCGSRSPGASAVCAAGSRRCSSRSPPSPGPGVWAPATSGPLPSSACSRVRRWAPT